LLQLNDNIVDDPFLLPPPKPDEAHPRDGSGSLVLDDAWPDERTSGALEELVPATVGAAT
jgi:hypothetical protein